MQTVLSITIPFFAIIFLGTIFSFKKVFNNEHSKVLTKFALYVTLPPFIFINILKASINESIFNWNFIIRFETVTLIMLFFTFLISILFLNNNKKQSSIFALNSAYPNYGYMGIPLCILAFGESSSIPISLILLIDTIILLTFTSYFANEHKSRNLIMEFLKLFFNMLKNPILLSVFIGFLFILFDLKLTNTIFNFFELLSYAATPTALFAIGINLYNKLEKNYYTQVSLVTIFKLFLHPLLMFLIFYYFPSNIPKLWINVAILCACLPIGGNVFAMSIFYNSFIKQTSNSILLTTILSTFSVPIVLFFLL